ncbi:helix-turn-helix domain-containing protein [Microbispora catharanthi]|uniref:Helix-turn-helix domain-containing protein n=1 Tax=Microbispora catharanthi TaxID=1712871 RepID=A0A5N6BYL0_9ACTN|nr:helix-turn-helix domain-containing protein [Microbispora catharanthi]
MQHIEWEIGVLLNPDRDWVSFAIGGLVALAGGYGTLWLYQQHAWWSWLGLLTGYVAVGGLVGVLQGVRRGGIVGRPEYYPAELAPRSGPPVTPSAQVLLTVSETAAAMRVSKATIYRLVYSGQLPVIRVRRWFRIPGQAVNDYQAAAEAGNA